MTTKTKTEPGTVYASRNELIKKTIQNLKTFSNALCLEEYHNPTDDGEKQIDELSGVIKAWEKETKEGNMSVDLMRLGIEAGYFLALQHFEECFSKRLKRLEEVSEKWNRVGRFEDMDRNLQRREMLVQVLDTIDAHRERIKKSFDFSEGGMK